MNCKRERERERGYSPSILAGCKACDPSRDAGVNETLLRIFLGRFHRLVDKRQDGVNALQSLDEVTVVIIIDGAIRHVGVSGRRGLHVDLLSASREKIKREQLQYLHHG